MPSSSSPLIYFIGSQLPKNKALEKKTDVSMYAFEVDMSPVPSHLL